VAAATLLLSGCGPQKSYNPVDWWHDLEGGPIAQNRPPPPGADMPYPNLGSVPQKPVVPDAATRAKVSSGLIADRANAQYTASLAPLAPAAPGGRNPPPRPPAAPAGDDQTPSATLQGASAPPTRMAPMGPPQLPLPSVPMTAPRPAPTTQVKSAPLAPPPAPVPPATSTLAQAAGAHTASDAPPSAPGAAPGMPPAPGATPASATETVLPTMPDRAPAPPHLPGVPQTTVAAPPPPTPPTPPPALAAGTGGPVAVPFPPGSSNLSLQAAAALKALAQKRGDSPIAVVGYGEAASSEAEAQVGALPLALARARAIAASLQQSGVPATAIRINAEAMGDGGAARLVP
jgi:outer membrane protein OmpA-like peptidoglycan-associated protein